MKRRQIGSIVLYFIMATACCSSRQYQEGNTVDISVASSERKLEIRIRNDSDLDFDEVQVCYPEHCVNYCALTKGNASQYEQVERAYSYAYIKVKVAEESFVLQPIDYAGETELSPGKYTYAISIDNCRLIVELEPN